VGNIFILMEYDISFLACANCYSSELFLGVSIMIGCFNVILHYSILCIYYG
jgi:hypothetical protein